ncbi:SEC-C motif-containing protein [Proteiniborus ethanoligenes]|uniref:SEC-C motif-containing protein n=1 Tax=Proteiniborus ethanoligenes TaxID=415015 RepID=A0A1H3JZL9_9FIRM|nr:SEC-C metal-binding domain-containing protein [Proteiniborus ethanoligenes]TAH63759.1 MAG: SEC-C domain-containing protein [Gottschalkiaceae bacterium]SDY45400.1 SEC-C motif-containing protein [Proteiniborus ethanoligenes]
MSLYKEWTNIAYEERDQKEYNEFWSIYLDKEKNVYKSILESKENILTGSIEELSDKYNLDSTTFVGFIDGINTSLINPVEIEKLEENSDVKLEIDFEKLYFNMLNAKAPWLYELPEWEEILSKEKRKEITKEYRASKVIVKEKKIGRNEPCPCGSGKKYKKCCGQ